jgi:uncharacterized repeat protein (TIGR01451 family)
VTKFSPDGSALAYSTYLGGSHGAAATGIAVDASGSAYVTGGTGSTDFPTVNPFQSTNPDFGAAFVAKFSADGSALVYSTYLGGTAHLNQGMLVGGSEGMSVVVDGSGSAYVTGFTFCTDFPTTTTAFQLSNHAAPTGNPNAFVTKFNPAGSALVYSTYLGGSRGDEANGIAIGGAGNAYVTGYTDDADFPTANPVQANNNASNNNTEGKNAFVTEMTPDGSGLVYSTYLGGSGNDTAYGIAVDSVGSSYVTGGASSTDFPTANAFQARKNSPNLSAFVAKIAFSADLIIHSLAPTVIASGSTLTYTILVTNNGPDAASNVSIQDVIPAGTTFNSVSVSSGSCTAPAAGGTGTVSCTAPSLANNGVITEVLTVNVTAGLGSAIMDTATVSSSTYDAFPGNNSAEITTTVI